MLPLILVVLKIYLTILLILSETCNGLNYNNCLSCTSPRHLYNNICCDYSWQFLKLININILF